MLVFFDASVLIAGFIVKHPQHSACLEWLKKAKKGTIKMGVSAHTLAETYAVLTGMPNLPKITGNMAMQLIKENITSIAQVASLSAANYVSLLEELATSGIVGSIVYDAIILKAAERANADKLLTLNQQHFQRLYKNKDGFISLP